MVRELAVAAVAAAAVTAAVAAVAAAAVLLRALKAEMAAVAAAVARWLHWRPQDRLRGRIVLVCDAGCGVGRAVAESFAACGCQVVCVDADAARSAEAARGINSQGARAAARAFACDVASPESVRQLASAVGRVDVLVSGAAPSQPLTSRRRPPSDAVDAVSEQMLAQLWLLLAFLPGMMERRSGNVVVLSRASVTEERKKTVPSGDSAVAGLLEALEEEMRLRARGVRVTRVLLSAGETQSLPPSLTLHDHRVAQLAVGTVAATAAATATAVAGAAALETLVAEETVRAVREEIACVAVPHDPLLWQRVLRAMPVAASSRLLTDENCSVAAHR